LIKARQGFPLNALLHQLKIKFAAEELLAVAERTQEFCCCQVNLFGIAGVEDDLLRVAFTVTDPEIVTESREHFGWV
jgi:hypothetical protein